MNQWERWDRCGVLRDRALDLVEQAAKERDLFRWWATACAIAVSLAIVLSASETSLGATAKWCTAGGVLLVGIGAGVHASRRLAIAAEAYAEARRAMAAFRRLLP